MPTLTQYDLILTNDICRDPVSQRGLRVLCGQTFLGDTCWWGGKFLTNLGEWKQDVLTEEGVQLF